MRIYAKRNHEANRERFWQLAIRDLGLMHITIQRDYVDVIVDYRGKPILKLPNGNITTGYHSFSARKGHRVQILNGLNLEAELNVNLHELRHVWQIESKNLKGHTMWQGKKVSKLTPYEFLPWELDARRYALMRLPDLALAAGYEVDFGR